MDNKLKIVSYLAKNQDRLFTMHELSKLVDIPYASFYRTIFKMKDILEIKNLGKSKIVQLYTANRIIQAYLSIASEEEKKEFFQKNVLIKKIFQDIKSNDIILLFGSYAKGKKTLSFSKAELLFQKKINPIFIDKKELKHMLKEKEENVGKQALRNHIVLNNPLEFWRLLFYE